MELRRRDVLRLAAGVALPAIATGARAQSYPDKPIRLLVGYPAGGQVDIVARLTAQFLSQQLGQSVVVENRPGAGGALGAEAIVKAPPDGYTLFMGTSSNAVDASLMQNLSFDFVRDVAPVAAVNRINLVLEASPSFPATTVAALIAQAKANPGKIDIASPSIGTPPYMAVELLKMMAGIDIVHVPYGGEGQMITDLLGGQQRVAIGGISSAIGHIKAGKLRALALTTARRIDELPGVPTVAETLPGFEASGFSGIVAPKNTPTPIVDKLAAAVHAVQADDKFKTRLSDLGVSELSMSPAEFGQFIAAETAKWRKVVQFG
ncbi:MAG: tripartite tricarboxylate transporter substrate binding protein [Xanthobacteraceae bacterium]